MNKKAPKKVVRKWTPEQKQKFQATMAAKRQGRAALGPDVQDAIIFLRHANRDITERMRAGKLTKLDRAHLLAMQALDALGG